MKDQEPHLHVVADDQWSGSPAGPGRQMPHLDELGFDARLMSADRLLRLAGNHSLYLDHDDGVDAFLMRLRCRGCGGAVTTLTDRHGKAYTVTGTQILMDILRHLVLRHDVPLSGEKEEKKWAGITPFPAKKRKIRLFRRR